jgi:hypothetical protein
VVANRVQTEDGTWRSLDGATLFRYTVALSELHEGVLHDLLTDRLGVGWTTHPRQHSATPRCDLADISTDLLDEFSTRTRAITECKDELVEAFVAENGRHPSNVETLKLRQRATLQTRPDKRKQSLPEQMASWRERAAQHAPGQPLTVRDLPPVDVPALAAGSVDTAMIDALGQSGLAAVSAKRAVFREANLLAEVHRQLHGARFATATDRLTIADRIVQRALDQAVGLAAPAQAAMLHRGTARFTTAAILDAETRLLDAGRDLTGPATPADSITGAESSLGPDQRSAVTAIATSGRVLDVLVGPAGSGKTTSLSALKRAWETTHGPGSVIGLAPSAAAAQVLADELGIATDNTAKWLHEQEHHAQRRDRIAELTGRLVGTRNRGSVWSRRIETERLRLETELDRWTLRPGRLLIIDEATLAGTVTLDTIATSAREAGAKVVLVGDWAQLGAIEAGGAFTCSPPTAPTRHTSPTSTASPGHGKPRHHCVSGVVTAA